jgi:hypothetical protein
VPLTATPPSRATAYLFGRPGSSQKTEFGGAERSDRRWRHPSVLRQWVPVPDATTQPTTTAVALLGVAVSYCVFWTQAIRTLTESSRSRVWAAKAPRDRI